MTRPIKFRAWDKESKSMHPITSLHSNGACHISVPRSVNNPMLNVDEYVLMQFTGLHDKNGKEIYEGDVVKHRKIKAENGDVELYGMQAYLIQDAPQVVKYEHCGFFPFCGWIDSANEDLQWEVIGNLHENPELLSDFNR